MGTKINTTIIEEIEKEIVAINLLCIEAISKLSKLDTDITEAENAARTAREKYDVCIDNGDKDSADLCLGEIRKQKDELQRLQEERKGPEFFNIITDLTARKERVISQAREYRREKEILFDQAKTGVEKASSLVNRVVHTLQPAINQIREKLEEKKVHQRRDEISPEQPGKF